MKQILSQTIVFLLLIVTVSCSGDNPSSKTSSHTLRQQAANSAQPTEVPAFDADSAYHYIAQQLEFGPRVPGTVAQEKTATWLADELRRHGAEVFVQKGNVKAYNGTRLPIFNIIGSYNPTAKKRVLLIAHWDSRHIADHDPNLKKRTQPVPGANDGASGVGVLLEMARQIGKQNPPIGIDIFLTDAEDYGAPQDWDGSHSENHWALGTQYWCKRPHQPGYRASYGILLDMVGAANAKFYKEYFSMRYAGYYVDKIWETAARLGYGDYFIETEGGAITDDHYFINRMMGIPTLDIIHTETEGDQTFFPFWHTTDDTLDKISKQTLQAVGETVMHTLWE